MRKLLPLLACSALLLPAYTHAATTKPTHPRQTMQQRFEQANTTHDGHLTLEQAQAGYKSVAKHFDAMDRDKKGYVTEDDIRAYYQMQRVLHRQASSTRKTPHD